MDLPPWEEEEGWHLLVQSRNAPPCLRGLQLRNHGGVASVHACGDFSTRGVRVTRSVIFLGDVTILSPGVPSSGSQPLVTVSPSFLPWGWFKRLETPFPHPFHAPTTFPTLCLAGTLIGVVLFLETFLIVLYSLRPFKPHGKRHLQPVSRWASAGACSVSSPSSCCPPSLPSPHDLEGLGSSCFGKQLCAKLPFGVTVC